MKSFGRTVSAFAIFLVIPLLALTAAAGIQWRLNAVLRQNLLKAYPQKSAVIENITVSSFCQLPAVQSDHDLSGLCTQNRNLSWMKSSAIFAICLGMLMLAVIKCAGMVARKRRFVLLLLFAPGLHLTMLAMSILAVLYAALGIGALYYGGSALFGEIPIGIMLAFGVGAIYAVISLIRAQLATVQKAKLTIRGKSLERSRHAKLWTFVEQLADRMNAKRPQNIVAGLEPNFYVTEAGVTIDGKLCGRTMYISLPLCRILSADELASVLGHELGHYKGFDTRFSKWFSPIYRGASQAAASFGPSIGKKGSAGDLVTLPVFVILSYFLESFSVAENEISRDRELSADNEAAKAVSARCIATSLVKIHAYAPVWPEVRDYMKQTIEKGKMVTNASVMFAEVVSRISNDAIGEISQEGPIHPTDTHPPLSERLRSLNFNIAEIEAQVSTHASAIDLIDSADGLEVELSEIVQAIMVKSGEARPEIAAEVVPATN